MENSFKCATCFEIFEFLRDGTWSEEKALAELKENFNEELNSSHVMVCDDCYEIIHPKNNKKIFKEYMESKQ